MSDLKSKLPSLNELGKMATTMFHAIKNGVIEVVDEYKKNRNTPEEEQVVNTDSVKKAPAADTTKPKTVKPKPVQKPVVEEEKPTKIDSDK